MKTISAKDAKNGFGRLLDTARGEPVVVQKHGRPFVVVLSVEEYQRIKKCAKESMCNPESTKNKK